MTVPLLGLDSSLLIIFCMTRSSVIGSFGIGGRLYDEDWLVTSDLPSENSLTCSSLYSSYMSSSSSSSDSYIIY